MSRRTTQHQAGEIHGSDQERHERQQLEHDERTREGLEIRVVSGRHGLDAKRQGQEVLALRAGMRRWNDVGLDGWPHCLEIYTRLLERVPRFQTASYPEPEEPRLIERSWNAPDPYRQRYGDIRFDHEPEPFEPARSNAHDRERNTIHFELSADRRVSPAELPLPEGVADDRDR